jgi:hypothetical protein
MDDRRTPRGFPVVGLAAAGMMAGHWLAYVIAVPRTSLRVRVLAESGHSYWMIAVQIALGMGLLSLGILAARRILDASEDRHVAGRPGPPSGARLALLQVALFTVVEVVERLGGGQPVGSMFQHHVFLAGVVIQCLVALAIAALLAWFGRVASRVATFAGTVRLPSRAAVPLRLSSSSFRPVLVLQGAAGLRSPPSR